MKKSLVVVALLVMGITVLWAGGATEKGTRNLSIGGAYGFMYESINDPSTPGYKTESTINTFAPQLSLVQTSEDSNWNYMFDISMDFPFALAAKASYETQDTGWIETDLDAFEKIYFYGIKMGGLYSIEKNEKMLIAAGPIASIQSFYYKTANDVSLVYYAGFGANIQGLFYLNDTFFFKAGANVVFNPIITNFYDTETLVNFEIDPSIGIGIRY